MAVIQWPLDFHLRLEYVTCVITCNDVMLNLREVIIEPVYITDFSHFLLLLNFW